MWVVDRPDVNDVDVQLDRALIRANGEADYELSADERNAIHQLYAAYDALNGEPDPSLQPAALDGCADALKAAYGQVQKGGRLEGLRGKLLARVLECPACGYGPGPTLDHHLPKDTYRALSIYPRNLIPTCQVCNRAKGTLQPKAGHGVIHPYFQELPEGETFFHADVTYENGKLTVTFRIDNPALDPALLQRLQFQMGRLKLNERYPSAINIFLFSLKPGFMYLKGTADEKERLRTLLLEHADSYDQDMKPNHWRSALMRGLAACEPFLDDPWTYFARPMIADVLEFSSV